MGQRDDERDDADREDGATPSWGRIVPVSRTAAVSSKTKYARQADAGCGRKQFAFGGRALSD